MNIKVKGLDEAIKRMSGMPARLQTELKSELRASADKIRKNASKDAPADVGKLRNSIVVVKRSDVDYSVIAQNSYAAYMEWGTKLQTDVPAELQAYAAQFKGEKGAGIISPVDALQAWVKRKGLAGKYSVKSKRRLGSRVDKDKEDRSLAFVIWRKIKKYGVKPHPFFFKHVFDERTRLSQAILRIFNEL